jgi:hypothetical protein
MRLTVREACLFGLILSALMAPFAARADEPAAGAVDGLEPTAKAPTHAGRARSGIEARSPGFETLADGSTRLSVEFSQPVSYDTRAAPGRVTYVMKGARVVRRNDYNPLVTVAFNTPVTSARLTPHGRDLWFVVELRAAVKPEVKTDAAKDGGMVIEIEFPKGDYVVAAADLRPAGSPGPGSENDGAPDPSAPAARGDSATTPAASSKRRRSGH